jgi:serine/threonine-protein kinase RsbW
MGGQHADAGSADSAGDAGRPGVGELRLHGVKALPDQLPPVRRVLRLWAAGAGLDGDGVEDLILATDEAMANVVDHAYPDVIGHFDLDAVRGPAGGITVTVTDYGRWHSPVMSPERSLRGRGLQLMKGLARAVEIEAGRTGTRVQMTFS